MDGHRAAAGADRNLTGFNAWSVGPITSGFSIPDMNSGLPGWSYWGQVATFWVWDVSLTVATFAYWRRSRAWNDEAASGRGPAIATTTEISTGVRGLFSPGADTRSTAS